jgi:hypothetical protein
MRLAESHRRLEGGPLQRGLVLVGERRVGAQRAAVELARDLEHPGSVGDPATIESRRGGSLGLSGRSRRVERRQVMPSDRQSSRAGRRRAAMQVDLERGSDPAMELGTAYGVDGLLGGITQQGVQQAQSAGLVSDQRSEQDLVEHVGKRLVGCQHALGRPRDQLEGCVLPGDRDQRQQATRGGGAARDTFAQQLDDACGHVVGSGVDALARRFAVEFPACGLRVELRVAACQFDDEQRVAEPSLGGPASTGAVRPRGAVGRVLCETQTRVRVERAELDPEHV